MTKETETKPVTTRQMLTSTLALLTIFSTFVYVSNRITEPKREKEFAVKKQQFNRSATLIGKENLLERGTTNITSALYFDLDGDKKTDSVMLIQQTEQSIEKRLATIHDMKIGDTKKVIEWAKPFAKEGVPIISKYRTDHQISYKELERE